MRFHVFVSGALLVIRLNGRSGDAGGDHHRNKEVLRLDVDGHADQGVGSGCLAKGVVNGAVLRRADPGGAETKDVDLRVRSGDLSATTV